MSEIDSEEPTLSQNKPDTFHGYTCTEDCSGREAGYQWIKNNSITDASACNDNSDSFNERCQACVEETGGETTTSLGLLL